MSADLGSADMFVSDQELECEPNPERCDGLDNDCDGDIDEDFRALPDDTCDGLDDDCDGYIDEGFSRGEVECGAGACAARGQTLCRDGLLESTCAPGAPAASDETCDGVDDDCSGAADEDFLARPVRCGLGECLRAGSVYCFNNQERLVCTPGLPEPDEEDSSCDGRDNDCDGVVDEGYAPAVTSCGAGACTAAGARLCVEGVEVDTCAPGAPVGADDSCDGVDDDCDGRLDERFAPRLTSCGLGVCAVAGQVVCDHLSSPPAEQTLCEPRAPSAALDVCDGLDNDCDGRTDEGHTPSATSCGAGLCARAGQLTCVGGRLVNTCVPGAAAAGELDGSCDRVDQDCDGRLDEGYEPTAVTCVAGSCAPEGALVCVDGAEVSTCRAGAAATDDATCDAFDDDCDGVLDEDAPVRASACGVGLCSSTGFELCAGGALVNNCAPGAALLNDATCDGLDQDCDGRVDEDAVDAPVSCGVGECMRVGVRRCLGGRLVSDCAAGAPSADTDCDGRDDDCDGRVDESFLVTRTTCGVGACASAGLRSCTPNGPQDSCAPIPPAPTDAVCDGVDSDCDGRVDEGYTRATLTCGVGACENHALTACVAGAVVSSCSPNAGSAQPDTSCDGFDDDCDGRVDEAYAPRAVTCPQGACAPTALEVCTLSGLTNTCVLSPAQSDPTCNGVDDDCDGLVDEDYAPAALDEPLSCGEGVCVGEGVLACLAGSVVVSCAPDLSLATPDSTCDGVDDDCDGRADESFGLALTCGVGACARQGAARCVEGARLDQCAPGAPSAERCGDGVDNDCDGSTDEGFAALGAPCAVGVGACAREGVEACGADALSTSCSAAPGAPSEELCNGVDDDCDGVVDESPTDAGAPCVDPTRFGVCAQGLTRCVGGSLSCEGDDGRAAAEEDYCTPADEDCDPATPALPRPNEVVPFSYEGQLRDVPAGVYVVLIRVGDRCGPGGGVWTCSSSGVMQCLYNNSALRPAECSREGTICCDEPGFTCQ